MLPSFSDADQLSCKLMLTYRVSKFQLNFRDLNLRLPPKTSRLLQPRFRQFTPPPPPQWQSHRRLSRIRRIPDGQFLFPTQRCQRLGRCV